MFDVSVWGAAFAGLLSFLSPCILPIVPPYLAFLAGLSLDDLTGEGVDQAGRRRVVLTAFAFALGLITVFVALGASATWIGGMVQTYAAQLRWVAGGIILLLGLHFLGVVRIPILYRQARIEVEARPSSLIGAYVVGMAFAFGWTPCVGPILAAILFTASQEDSVRQGMGLLLAYGVGMAAPFVAAAWFIDPFIRLMKKFRKHMGKVEKTMGAFLVLTGIIFITGQINVISEWMLNIAPDIGTLQ
ncbi:MAG: cytochrome c biogenesis CcdA family protein [Rubrimonas sp.]|uniref:cytochrome c biogenesis CcdA family protein n=1 Tax=Rubrimonas sp. TaxID=2036015 RepID=UPI002FDD035A